jgi:hypothetical protein
MGRVKSQGGRNFPDMTGCGLAVVKIPGLLSVKKLHLNMNEYTKSLRAFVGNFEMKETADENFSSGYFSNWSLALRGRIRSK